MLVEPTHQVTRSFDHVVTWTIKKLISAFQQNLWHPDLAGMWLRHEDTSTTWTPFTKPREPLTKWSRGHYLLNVFKTPVTILLIILNLLCIVLSRRENYFDTILLNFSELLGPEITKSNEVQICQFILIRWNQTFFSMAISFLFKQLIWRMIRFLRKYKCHIWT